MCTLVTTEDVIAFSNGLICSFREYLRRAEGRKRKYGGIEPTESL